MRITVLLSILIQGITVEAKHPRRVNLERLLKDGKSKDAKSKGGKTEEARSDDYESKGSDSKGGKSKSKSNYSPPTLSPTREQACSADEGELVFEYETDASTRLCALFGYIADDSSVADLAIMTSTRDICPCNGQEASAVCPSTIVQESSVNFTLIAPAECRDLDAPLPTLVSTPVCGSSFETARYDVYRQYCATNIPAVQEVLQETYPTFQQTLQSYAAELQSVTVQNLPSVDKFLVAVEGLAKLQSEVDLDNDSRWCLEGCATFIANACCGDDEFVELQPCQVVGSSIPLDQVPTDEAELADVSTGELTRTLATAGKEPSNCDETKPFPGETMIGERIFYNTFGGTSLFTTNRVESRRCMTVRFYRSLACPQDAVLAAAYLNPFNPLDLSANYIGDTGRVTRQITDFSFSLAMGASFELVVMETRPSEIVCPFNFTVYEDDTCNFIDE